MSMLDQLLANLYQPSKQEKSSPLSGKQAAQAIKTHAQAQMAAVSGQTLVSQGQFLRGEVLDLRANQILVLLENGATVSARTEGTLDLAIGENARFFVSQTKEDQIILKHVKEDSEPENPMIEKALSAAGITRTEKSVAIVSELLSHSQPVTEANIRHYLSLSAKYPDLPVKDFILMDLHQVPVTPETVSAFSSYHDGNGQLLTQATNLIAELTAQIDRLPEGDIKQQFLQEFRQILAEPAAILPEGNLSMNKGIPVSVATAADETGSPTESGTLTETTMLSEHDTRSGSDTPVQTLTTDMVADIRSENSETSPSRVTETPPNDFLSSFLLSPEEVADADKVKHYYENINQKLAALEQLAQTVADTAKEPAVTAPKQMRSNLSFMESVNQVVPFLQLPLKFKETPAHGELYVYERKRALKPTDSFSALLHLDMEALGSMDVFVTLAGQHITARFSMTQNDSADLIRTELPSLSDALAKQGYSLTSDVTVTEPDTENAPTLLEQFLELHAPGGVKRYTFDIRA